MTCRYFCDKPPRYKAYGSIAEMKRDIQKEKDEKFERLSKEAK